MDFFEARESKEKKAAIMNVIAVMLADGRIDDREKTLLGRVCQRVGLGLDQLEEMLSNPSKVQFVVPASPKERLLQLVDMVFMMLADEEIDARELAVTDNFARRLGFSARNVRQLVTGIIEGVKRGHTRLQVSDDVDRWAQS